MLNLELSTVSRRVRVLEERQLIEREPGKDRRTSHLRLTPDHPLYHDVRAYQRERVRRILESRA